MTDDADSKVHDALLYLWMKLEDIIRTHSEIYLKLKDETDPEKKLVAERCLAIMHLLKNIAFHQGPMVENALGHKKNEERAVLASRVAGWVPPDVYRGVSEKYLGLAAEYQEIAKTVEHIFGLDIGPPVTLPQRIRNLKAAYYDKSDNLDAMQRGIRYGECVACHQRRAVNHAGLCMAEVGLVEGVKMTDFKDYVPSKDLEGGS